MLRRLSVSGGIINARSIPVTSRTAYCGNVNGNYLELGEEYGRLLQTSRHLRT